MLALPTIAIVSRETRLNRLLRRKATRGAAKFALALSHEHERAKRQDLSLEDEQVLDDLADAAGYDEYADEGQTHDHMMKRLRSELDLGYPIVNVDRTHLPNFDFGRCVLVVVVGQDGLVANAAKYVGDLPIVAVNPDPERNDGVLLPFDASSARRAVQRVVAGHARFRSVTLAHAQLNDGQELFAFNDFFIGANSHISARYTLESGSHSEPQSSSGLLVSTGAGSTGWLSSVFNMADGIGRFLGAAEAPRPQINWEDRRLVWTVREPFRSRHSRTDLVAGVLEEGDELVIGSQMPTRGVIFSDGVEADFLEFNSGTIARFTVSSQRARLVVP